MKTLEQVIEEMYARHQFGWPPTPPGRPKSAVKLYGDDVQRFAQACYQAGAEMSGRASAERDEAVALLRSLAGGPDAQLWIVIRTKARALLARIDGEASPGPAEEEKR